MSDVIEQTMGKATFIANPAYEDYVSTDQEAREIAIQYIRY
jgi:1-deoxy-D-xylulose-5-phosphate reductoisomerase